MRLFRHCLQFVTLALFAALATCTHAITPTPAIDRADSLVYAHYPRGLMPTKLEMDVPSKFEVLTAPATLEDVRTGQAIFSFEGLGEHRVWKPQLPVTFAEWKNGKTHNNFAAIRQMEELNVNGQWKLYFGLVLHEGAVVVPANEVSLELDEEGPVLYLQLPGGLDWGVRDLWNPCYTSSDYLFPNQPAILQVFLRNRSPLPQTLPVDFFRPGNPPALRDGVTLHLQRAPYNPRAASTYYPTQDDYKEVVPPRLGSFIGTRTRLLQPGQVIPAFQLDLQAIYPNLLPGRYQVSFSFDRAKLGLPDEATYGAGSISFELKIGASPAPLTPAELNQTIPPLGSPDAVSRLEKLIRADLPAPLPASPPEPKDFTPPVAGLALRIDAAVLVPPDNAQYLLRIKNVSNHALALPANWRTAVSSRVQQQDGQVIDGPSPGAEEDSSEGMDMFGHHTTAHSSAIFTLPPGQSAGIFAEGKIKITSPPQNLTVSLTVPNDPNVVTWSGSITTPAAKLAAKWPVGILSAPTVLVPHILDLSFGRLTGNGSGEEPDTQLLWWDNNNWIASLHTYDPASRRDRLESLLKTADNPSEHPFFVSLATAFGSRHAALELLTMLQNDDDERAILEARAALAYALTEDSSPCLVQLAIAAISDRRYVLHSKLDQGPYPRIGEYFTDPLVSSLGWDKIAPAVPALLDLVKDHLNSDEAISALAQIGDARAIPVLLANLEKDRSQLNQSALFALAHLHAKSAVPVLLQHLYDSDAIEALRLIGDPQIKAPLEKLVAANGKVENDPLPETPERTAARLFTARMTLAWLAGPDGITTLCQLARDQSLTEYQRREAVWHLGDRPDPRAIPTLLDALRKDPSGAVVGQSITVLSAYKYQAAVTGLIDCFDADFAGKEDWKRAYQPTMFQDNIAQSLRTITGESFGSDKKLWANWWHDNAAKRKDLP